MKLKNVDNDKDEIILLAECRDCGYVGNKGIWKGTVTIGEKLVVPLEGVVELSTDETWQCDDIIADVELQTNQESGAFTGEAYCPICDSPNFD